MIKVGYLGPEGTYTHQAAIQQFGNSEEYELLPLSSINDCFERLNNDEIKYSVVPFENSTNGQVMFTYDLFREWLINNESQMHVVAEQFVSIHHNLLSKVKDISKIKKIYTHPQAWGQCTNWLKQYASGIQKIDSSSTSKAAEIAKEANEEDGIAAIASSYASTVHDIPILYPHVENNSTNTTRFLILSKENNYINTASSDEDKKLTVLAFILKNNEPGELVKTLNVLSDYGIDMTSITSRPSLIQSWQYIFFIEFYADYFNDGRIKTILEEFDLTCQKSIVLGCFSRNQSYYKDIPNK
ncbi:hypothetical protein WICPIJ_001119 [Wickerhamomyces pijperi]|uniref:prephenate dehydratase n=1 Tax=Wickerhamomyces pijperi TaxID=599730 RepID=A0A9P8QBC4_WICPI|nr:hypothetical protein WICPIJ_001119 [Wickerhamomyces pijperi]